MSSRIGNDRSWSWPSPTIDDLLYVRFLRNAINMHATEKWSPGTLSDCFREARPSSGVLLLRDPVRVHLRCPEGLMLEDHFGDDLDRNAEPFVTALWFQTAVVRA